MPAWAEPVRAGSAQPVRASAAARVAPPGFDARQFRELARALPDIRFVLGAGCLPTDELARLAALPNVHVMLTEILPWTGSLEFAHAFGTLLRAFGAERLLFGSGYPMMRPGPLVRALATYRFPAEVSPPLPALRRRRGPRRARRQRGPALPHPARARRRHPGRRRRLTPSPRDVTTARFGTVLAPQPAIPRSHRARPATGQRHQPRPVAAPGVGPAHGLVGPPATARTRSYSGPS